MSDLERGQVTLTDATTAVQTLQAQVWGADDVRDGVEHWEPQGITSRPMPATPAGGPDVLIGTLGSADHSVAICVTDRRSRPTGLAAGDTTVYSTHPTQVRIDLVDGGIDIVVGAGGVITLGGRTARAVLGDLLVEMLKGHTHGVRDDIAGASVELMDLDSALSSTVLVGE